MDYFWKIIGWTGLILLTFIATTFGCNLLNAATYPFESLLGLVILLLVGGFWLNMLAKGVKICYEYLKACLE